MSNLAALAAAIEGKTPEMTLIPQENTISEWGLTATNEMVKTALDNGRAVVTVRSRESRKHVTIEMVGRKKKTDGHGWVSRATCAGRVGMATGADVIEVRDPRFEFGEDAHYVGRLYLDTGEFKAGKGTDQIRPWVARMVLAYAAGAEVANSEVFLAAQCSSCGKKLTDPESIERIEGPECYGKKTSSKVAH